jgi:hypothetical protein
MMSTNEITRPGAYTRAVTPSDTVNLPGGLTRGLNLGVSGDVKVTFSDGSTDTLVGLAAGVPQPYQVLRVWATGTTAASISAIY